MEVMLKRHSAAKDEKLVVDGDEEDIGKIGNETPPCEGDSSKSSSPCRRDSSNSKQEEQIESTKAEMGEVKEENERLKTILAKIVKDYQSLQTHFLDVVRQEQDKKPAEKTPDFHQEPEEHEFISLSLGSTATGNKPKEEKAATSPQTKEQEQMEGLTLGLDCKFDRPSSIPSEPQSNLSPENSFEEPKEEDQAAGEPWPPSKILKTLRSGDDEVPQQAQVKKARVSVRARCDTPTMNDGCQWRKYGQKIAKGNPCPRAYYRCTVAPACPVRKQVQRCAEDMSILITTYEGTHNHPLPISATAMASTTSAAACMLTSGYSSSSRPAIGAPAAAIGANARELHGLNFSLLDNNSMPRQFFLPNSSITSSPSYPTITLDLTSPPSSSTTQFSSNLSSNLISSSAIPRYSSSTTSLNFSSSDQFRTSSVPWSNGWSQAYSNKNLIGSFNHGRHNSQELFYQSYMQKTTNSNLPPAPTTHQHPLTDTIAAATKAITADPSFQSALAAAITSIVGHGSTTQSMGESLTSQSLKWGEHFSLAASSPYTSSATNGNGCASSYLNRSSASSTPNTQPPNSMFLQPSLAYSNSKSASMSPVSNKEHIS